MISLLLLGEKKSKRYLLRVSVQIHHYEQPYLEFRSAYFHLVIALEFVKRVNP